MIDVRVPDEQEGTKAVVRAWLKRVGDVVREHDPLVELETDKVTQEVPAPAAGLLREILLDTDAEVGPGDVLGRIEESSPAQAGAQERRGALLPQRPGPRPSPGNTESRFSPAVRGALRQHHLDAATITGTGRDGRITRADVDRAAGEDAPPDRMRQRIAENMVRAMADAPHVTSVFEADVSAVAAHRAALAADGVKLSTMAYVLKAAAEAMAAAPAINGRWESNRVAIAPSINIGVGTALGDKGLVVPVVREVGALSLEEIGVRLDDLTQRARSGQLTAADVAGGTFTISNHGVSGSLLAAPIILHAGQAAILGLGKIEKRVVVRDIDGEEVILVRPMTYVTLTIDHRVVDAHQTNAWLSRFVDIIEAWPAT